MTTTKDQTGTDLDKPNADKLAALLCCLYEGAEIQQAAMMLIEQAMEIEELRRAQPAGAGGLADERALFDSVIDGALDRAKERLGKVDTERMDWLDQNLFHREMNEWDARLQPEQWMWVLFAPKGVQGSAFPSRKIIDAARSASTAHAALTHPSVSASQPEQEAAEEFMSTAAARVRALTKAGMELGAQLAQAGTETFKGVDYLLRDHVMDMVAAWRTAFDNAPKLSDEAARSLISRATQQPSAAPSTCGNGSKCNPTTQCVDCPYAAPSWDHEQEAEASAAPSVQQAGAPERVFRNDGREPDWDAYAAAEAGAPAQAQPDLKTFAAWLEREMPPGTVISDPTWWAPRIFRAALSASPSAPAVQVEKLDSNPTQAAAPAGLDERERFIWQMGYNAAAERGGVKTVSLDAILNCYSPDDTVSDYQDKIRAIYTGAAPAEQAIPASVSGEAFAIVPRTPNEAIRRVIQDINSDSGEGWKPSDEDGYWADLLKAAAPLEAHASAAQEQQQDIPYVAFVAPASQQDSGDLVAQPRLYARLMEMSEIIRAGSRWDGNEQVFADKSESDVAMLDDILGDALRLAAEPPCEQSSTAGAAKGGETSTDSSKNLAAQTTTASASEPDLQAMARSPHNVCRQIEADLRKENARLHAIIDSRAPAPSRSAAPAEKVSCPACSGTGSVMMDGDCSDCNGKGYCWEPVEGAAPAGGEDARDTRRLNLMISDKCIMDSEETTEGTRYWLSWPYLHEEQREVFKSPRDAIDAQLEAMSTMQQSTDAGGA